jgi:hypothetical protein
LEAGMEVNGTKRLKGKSPNIRSTFISRFTFIGKWKWFIKGNLIGKICLLKFGRKSEKIFHM